MKNALVQGCRARSGEGSNRRLIKSEPCGHGDPAGRNVGCKANRWGEGKL